MLIDCILDRRDEVREGYDTYNPREFYYDVVDYANMFEGDETQQFVVYAMDELEEEDVKRALCNYITRNHYNKEICDFINEVNWLGEE